ncbi:hypothetical protein J3459_015234 [Metarhizium acridum]|uniref:uncharacterized protein n=1 Tax=Metarhizium acridum TaxID=92637 RepID=UPI001C6CBDA6|nr:hypothetical protein J3459_015234 [Metarhizium acridum]KAG8414132.1 hypothetical protein J3458_011782 [Metarhizium acridum]
MGVPIDKPPIVMIHRQLHWIGLLPTEGAASKVMALAVAPVPAAYEPPTAIHTLTLCVGFLQGTKKELTTLCRRRQRPLRDRQAHPPWLPGQRASAPRYSEKGVSWQVEVNDSEY